MREFRFDGHELTYQVPGTAFIVGVTQVRAGRAYAVEVRNATQLGVGRRLFERSADTETAARTLARELVALIAAGLTPSQDTPVQ